MKTLLKICPNCETKKKRHETRCSNCGYDFIKNEIYSVEADIRETNALIRKHIKRQHRKDTMKTIGNIFLVGTVCLAGVYCYMEEIFENK